jgi:hypothetical protein
MVKEIKREEGDLRGNHKVEERILDFRFGICDS